MILRALKVFLASVAAAALLVIAIFVAIYLPGLHHRSSAGPVAADFSRTDFITIILAAVAVMLGALGLVLAVAGAIGYVTVRSAAELAAKVAAERVASERAEQVAGERAEVVATRLVRELVPQLVQQITTDPSRPSPDADDAFMKAEGQR